MKVEAKVTGQRRRPTDVREVEVPAGDSDLRSVIDAVVRSEVDAFRLRQLDGRLLQVLSPEQIAAGVEVGRITSGGSDLDQDVDPDTAVATALESFADGLYFVFVDDRQIEGLDEVVAVTPDSTLLFVRLVPLVGG
jgi:hypothetical protein